MKRQNSVLVPWENVYIFISSTFNDMHAERDYLVKQVFPELESFCYERRLRLHDIDLRWGVSEEDASVNKRVVEVCLENIDKCRPFFLGFLGQRRGWVPSGDQVNEETLKLYPKLQSLIGKYSITEFEIIHALFNPLNSTKQAVPHALFYLRDDAYLADVDNEAVRALMNPGASEEFDAFKEKVRSEGKAFSYQAIWDKTKKSPELEKVDGQDLSEGRLTRFRVGDESLKQHILEQLKEEILKEYPDRAEIAIEMDDFEKELDAHNRFMMHNLESYVPRPDEEEKVLSYIAGEESCPLVLASKAGMGKTALLSHLIAADKIPGNVIYRFVGATSQSTKPESVLESIVENLYRDEWIEADVFEQAMTDVCVFFAETMYQAAEKLEKQGENLAIIIDGVSGFQNADDTFSWLPRELGSGIRMVLTTSCDKPEEALPSLGNDVVRKMLSPFTGEMDKMDLIKRYMSQFLKDINETQMHYITEMAGSDNPLFLKIILNELRIHGSFESLFDLLTKNYGIDPEEAFISVIDRMSKERYCEYIRQETLINFGLGMPAYAKTDLNIDDLVYLLHDVMDQFGVKSIENLTEEDTAYYMRAIRDDFREGLICMYRHLSAFLRLENNRVNFLHDSFRKAVKTKLADEERNFHISLFFLYHILADDGNKLENNTYKKANAEIMDAAAYHECFLNLDIVFPIYMNPWFLLRLCELCGVDRAIYYYDTVEKRLRNEWDERNDQLSELADQELAAELGREINKYKVVVPGLAEVRDLLIHHKAEVKELPQSIFYYLKSSNKSGNEFINRMTEVAVKELPNIRMVIPRYCNYEPGFTLESKITMLTAGTNIYSQATGEWLTCYGKDYIVYVDQRKYLDLIRMLTADVKAGKETDEVHAFYEKKLYSALTRILFQSMKTGKVERIISVSGMVQNVKCVGNRLFIVYNPEYYSEASWEIYELPSMRKTSGSNPELEDGFEWKGMDAVEGILYKEAEKETEEGILCRIYDAVNRRLVFEFTRQKEELWHMKGGYLSLEGTSDPTNFQKHNIRIYCIKTGELIYEQIERPIKIGMAFYEDSGFIIEQNLLTQKGFSVYEVKHTEDGVIKYEPFYIEVREGEKELSLSMSSVSIFHSPIYVTEDLFYLGLNNGDIYAFERDGSFAGRLHSDENLSLKWGGLVEIDADYFALKGDKQMLIYSKKQLLELDRSPVTEEECFPPRLSPMVKDRELYLLGQSADKVQFGLKTKKDSLTDMRRRAIGNEHFYYFYSSPMVLGTLRSGRNWVLTAVDMKRWEQLFTIVINSDAESIAGGFFCNNIAGIVEKEEVDKADKMVVYTYHVSRKKVNFMTIEDYPSFDINIRHAGWMAEQLVGQKDVYFVFFNVWNGSSYNGIQVWSVSREQCVLDYTHEGDYDIDLDFGGFLSSAGRNRDHLVVTAGNRREGYHLFELALDDSEAGVSLLEREIPCHDILTMDDDFVYLRDGGKGLLHWYSLTEHQILRSAAIEPQVSYVGLIRCEPDEDAPFYLLIRDNGLIEFRDSENFEIYQRQILPAGNVQYLMTKFMQISKFGSFYSNRSESKYTIYRTTKFSDLPSSGPRLI